jgi:hypothetical protein
MSAADVRSAWLQMRDEVSAMAVANKQSQEAVLAMAERYRSLSEDERAVVDRLLSEFRITTALPALRVLADRLETQHSPGAPYEWAKVNRLIALLVEPPESGQDRDQLSPRSPPDERG